jgi:hypothetical protein
VLAAWVKDGQNHQIRIRKQPLLGFRAGSFGHTRQSTQVFILGHRPEVIQADPRQARDLVLGEEFLARLDSDHMYRLTVTSMLKQA